MGSICNNETKRRKDRRDIISLNSSNEIKIDVRNSTPLINEKTIKGLNNKKLIDFLDINNIQGLQNETDDLPFNELKTKEQEILTNEVENHKDNLINKISKTFNFGNINS